ncbi:MAG: hypothetical protein ABI591_18865 [Kofleriaceae bacterium]
MIVVGALFVAALAIVLLFELTSHTEPASAAASAVRVHATTTTPPASGVTAAPPPAAPPVEPHARAMPSTRAPTLPPVVATPTDPIKPKHIDTPTDILRWSLMRAIRNTEPAVIDCLDKAKAAGAVVDGTAMFAFYVTRTNAKAVISRASVEASPFPDAVNTCIQGTLASGELDQELPDGQDELRVLRTLVVDKGAITQYKLQSFVKP